MRAVGCLVLSSFAVVGLGCGAGDGNGTSDTTVATTTGDDSASTGTPADSGTTGAASTATSSGSSAAADTSSSDSTGGGGLSPTATCEAYLACAAATIPAELGPLLETYGPDGTCWQSTPEVAEQCDMACEVGLMQLLRFNEEEPACGGFETEGAASTSTGGAGCGNGVADPGESCDGDDLNGYTCESLGLMSGVLSCTNCKLDTSACLPP